MSIQRARDKGGTRIIKGFVPARYDQVDMTYDASGNISTVTFTDRGTALVTLTLTYNASGQLTRVVCTDLIAEN